MIAILDLRSEGNTHVPFNAALIRILLEAIENDRILILGEPAHLRLVRQELPPADGERLGFKPIAIPGETWRLELQFVRYLWLFFRYFRGLTAAGVTKIVMPYGSSPMISAAWILLKTIFRKLELDIILHGDLATLAEDGPPFYLSFRRLFAYRFSLKLARFPRIKIIVLEYTIKEAVGRLLPNCADALVVLPHPIPLRFRSQNTDTSGSDDSLIVAYLGLATVSKGFDTFLELAEMAPAGVTFWSIGYLHPSMAHLDTGCLARSPWSQPLPRSQFERLLSQAHYVFLPYRDRYYAYAASGVLMDAIAFAKPIIAIRTALLEHLCGRYGPIGYVFEDKQELSQFVAHLKFHHAPEEYHRFKKNMEAMLQDRSVAKLAEFSIWKRMIVS